MATGDPVKAGFLTYADDNTQIVNSRTKSGNRWGLSAMGQEVGVHGLGKEGVHGQGDSNHQTGTIGVLGEADDGVGVMGLATGDGIGVVAQGGAASIRLSPQNFVGAPQSGRHGRGEMVVDRKGDLYLCKRSGTPGKWKLIG